MLAKVKPVSLIVPLTNMGLRGMGLVGRFALSFYLVKFLTLTETGQFGLIVGVAGVLPALFGFGMNYFLSREIIGIEIANAIARIRDKMVVMAGLLVVTFVSALIVNYYYPIKLLGDLWLAGIIIMLEVIAFDLHVVLISLRKPLLANFLLIIRSAAWVFPFIAITYYYPRLRTLDTLLLFWLLALFLCFLLLALFTRHWPWRRGLRARIDTAWISRTIGAAHLIYISDLGLVIYSYFDRFFIAGKLGLAATGVYTFYWTMANALLVLITAAVVQVSLPGLVDGIKIGEAEWRKRFRQMLLKAAGGSLTMAALMYFGVGFLLPHIGNSGLARHPLIFPLMLAAIVIKIGADMTHYGLYSRSRDRTLALVNISGILVNLALTVTMVSLFGLIGVAFSMLGTAVYLLVSRGFFLSRDMAAVAPSAMAKEPT